MKVVLRENVEKLGKRGDIVSVAPGYGRNYLIPKNLAYLDTPGFKKMLAAERRAKEVLELREKDEAEALAARIGSLALVSRKKVGEEGHLYGSVTAQEISDLLAEHGIEMDKRRVVLDEPIRTVGAHAVPVRVHKDVTAQVSIEVIPEDE